MMRLPVKLLTWYVSATVLCIQMVHTHNWSMTGIYVHNAGIILLSISLFIQNLHNHTLSVVTHSHIGCGSLTVLNGSVTFTNRSQIGSIATHSCDEGYQPQDSSNTFRICEMTGWNASNFTCGS